MSANDRNDWDDGLDFESLADEQLEDVTEPEVEVDDYADEPAAEAMDEPAPDEEVQPVLRPRSSGPKVSSAGLGLLFAFSVLVAAIGIGGALVLALGVDPVSLWQPDGFRQVDQFMNLEQHPINLVYIVTLATLLLTLLGGWAISRSVRKVGDSARRDAELIDRVAALRIDDEHGWQDHLFRDHPQLSNFVTENLGTWRMHELRQKRSTGLDGELQRLTKAASAQSRDEIAGRYDHPVVGSLADEFVGIIDDRASARREAEAFRTKDQEASAAIIKSIGEVAGASLSFTDQVGVQGAAAAGLASRLRDLVAELSGNGNDHQRQQVEGAADALRQEVQKFSRDEESRTQSGETYNVHDLAERGNKLAFQIAMEVARLGSRGERLLPMTQALEELTTDFRHAADQLGAPVEGNGIDDFRDRCNQHLVALQGALEGTSSSGRDEVMKGVEAAVPAATQIAGQLGSIAEQSNDQTQRVHELGVSCGELTGLTFDPESTSTPETIDMGGADLALTPSDPFSTGAAPEPDPGTDDEESPLQADPFSAENTSLGGLEIEPSVSEGFLSTSETKEYDPWSGADVADAPTPAAPEDDVLDLSAFGAVKVEDDAEPATEDIVHELTEFGAVRMD